MVRVVSMLAAAAVLCVTSALPAQVGQPVQAPQDELASPKLRISWDHFKKLYDAGGAVVIDVRDTVSYEAGHIPGARSVPLDQIEKQIPALRKLTQPIVLYCA